ncbi:hypothetical protein BP6252_11464 [Coleophoma cylindrospora]|uniref:DUF7053 domain-containing protein n=1 Tax=Coleophoma cylindrospora TaxID=1849047 RepID=A0A3D8QJX8_9HELO|nr:hypothetical protein BP6252_11464 [Coleophoma cylindrospora]
MSKRTVFTTITPLPAGISRQTVIETLHDHLEMIDLNPSHESRERIKPPPEATPEEYHCTWYGITDKIQYLPGNLASGKVSFKACFHDLANGVQVHCYAPAGTDIKEKFTLGGTLPGEPVQPVEIGYGVPIMGLYLREDVELRCNFLMTRFVKKTLKQSLETLVARMIVRSQLVEATEQNRRLTYDPYRASMMSPAPPLSPPLSEPGKEPPQWFLEARQDAEMAKGRASYPQYPQQLLHQQQQQQLLQQQQQPSVSEMAAPHTPRTAASQQSASVAVELP